MHRNHFLYIFLFFVLLFPQSGHSASTLTNSRVKAFLENSTQLLSQGGPKGEAAKTFLRQHVAEEGMFQAEVTTYLPGQPPQTQMLNLGKAELIEKFSMGMNLLQDYSAKLKIMDIEIGPQKRSARAHTMTLEQGKLPLPAGLFQPGEGAGAGAEDGDASRLHGTSSCWQTVSLNAADVMQLKQAMCRVEIRLGGS